MRPTNDLVSGLLKAATFSMDNLKNIKWLNTQYALQTKQISELSLSIAAESDKYLRLEEKYLAINQENNGLKSQCGFQIEQINHLTQLMAEELEKAGKLEEKNYVLNQQNLELQQELQRLTGFKYWIKKLLINLFLNKTK